MAPRMLPGPFTSVNQLNNRRSYTRPFWKAMYSWRDQRSQRLPESRAWTSLLAVRFTTRVLITYMEPDTELGRSWECTKVKFLIKIITTFCVNFHFQGPTRIGIGNNAVDNIFQENYFFSNGKKRTIHKNGWVLISFFFPIRTWVLQGPTIWHTHWEHSPRSCAQFRSKI